MRTVNEVSRLTGVSIRTLHYYDTIGLLKPTQITQAGYRLYDDTALERLQCVLLFRELQFSLSEIREILDSPNFDRSRALEQQITLLELRKEHIENLIDLARGIKVIGVKPLMDFSAFDTRKIDEYARQAKAAYGKTAAYQEFEQKNSQRTQAENQSINLAFSNLFAQFCTLRELPPDAPKVQQHVKALQDYITANFYACTDEMLRLLGQMYVGGGEMTENIERACGAGTAEFVHQAIEIYCNNK